MLRRVVEQVPVVVVHVVILKSFGSILDDVGPPPSAGNLLHRIWVVVLNLIEFFSFIWLDCLLALVLCHNSFHFTFHKSLFHRGLVLHYVHIPFVLLVSEFFFLDTFDVSNVRLK